MSSKSFPVHRRAKRKTYKQKRKGLKLNILKCADPRCLGKRRRCMKGQGVGRSRWFADALDACRRQAHLQRHSNVVLASRKTKWCNVLIWFSNSLLEANETSSSKKDICESRIKNLILYRSKSHWQRKTGEEIVCFYFLSKHFITWDFSLKYITECFGCFGFKCFLFHFGYLKKFAFI